MWVRHALAACLLALPLACLADSQPKPAVTIELKTLGMASDLYANQPDNRDEARAVLDVFWISPDRLASVFSTSPRFQKPNHPEPYQVRLVVFDSSGKEYSRRDWTFAETGPEATALLAFQAGPEGSILAIHATTSDTPGLPEGNLIQVLSPETKLQQNFYIASDSVLVPSSPPGSALVVQQFHGNGKSTLHFWSGAPLKDSFNFRLSRQTETLAGPREAAQQVCSKPGVCPGAQVIRPDGSSWVYAGKESSVLHPRAFLTPSTLLAEVETKENPSQLLLLHADAAATELQVTKHGDRVADFAGMAADGSRFAIDVYGESGVCGFLDLACSHRSRAIVVSADKLIFEAPLSAAGGKSSLSPDGKHLAVLDRGKLLLFTIP